MGVADHPEKGVSPPGKPPSLSSSRYSSDLTVTGQRGSTSGRKSTRGLESGAASIDNLPISDSSDSDDGLSDSEDDADREDGGGDDLSFVAGWAEAADADQLLAVDTLNTQTFAIKRLPRSTGKLARRYLVSAMLSDLNSRPHFNSILTTVRMEGRFFRLSAWADGNLYDLWADTPHVPLPEVSAWIVRQCHGIASVASLMHAEYYTHYPRQLDLISGNITPRTVLWFSSKDGIMLKLSSSALAESGSHHHRLCAHQAPECEDRSHRCRMPSRQMWSLGSTMLEFITWHLLGWEEGNLRFSRQRSWEKSRSFQVDTYFTVTSRNRRIEVKESVRMWIERLRQHRYCNALLSDMLDLISDRLLVVEPRKRATAGEVQATIESILGAKGMGPSDSQDSSARDADPARAAPQQDTSSEQGGDLDWVKDDDKARDQETSFMAVVQSTSEIARSEPGSYGPLERHTLYQFPAEVPPTRISIILTVFLINDKSLCDILKEGLSAISRKDLEDLLRQQLAIFAEDLRRRVSTPEQTEAVLLAPSFASAMLTSADGSDDANRIHQWGGLGGLIEEMITDDKPAHDLRGRLRDAVRRLVDAQPVVHKSDTDSDSAEDHVDIFIPKFATGRLSFLNFPMNIAECVDFLLKPLNILRQERPVASGAVRIRWKCRCGELLYDDYTPIRENWLSALKNSLLQRTGGARLHIKGDGSNRAYSRRGILSYIQGGFTWAIECSLFLLHLGSALPRAGLPLHSLTVKALEGSEDASFKSLLHILLCIDKSKHWTMLHQERLQNVTDDASLFEFLREQYRRHRSASSSSWLSLKAVKSVSLARFKVDPNDFADVHPHTNACQPSATSRSAQPSPTPSSTHIAPDDPAVVTTCVCLPPLSRIHSREYLCRPEPEAKLGYAPAIGPNELTHYFQKPHCLRRPQRAIFNQLPKRAAGKLIASPDDPTLGWGLHLEEERVHARSLHVLIALLLAAGAVAFGVAWAVTRGDVQTGFTVAAVWVGLGAMVLAWATLPEG